MLGRDHAILDRIQAMRNEQLYDAAQRYWLQQSEGVGGCLLSRKREARPW